LEKIKFKFKGFNKSQVSISSVLVWEILGNPAVGSELFTQPPEKNKTLNKMLAKTYSQNLIS